MVRNEQSHKNHGNHGARAVDVADGVGTPLGGGIRLDRDAWYLAYGMRSAVVDR